MKRTFNSIWLFAIVLAVVSCVPPKHFAEIETENNDCKQERESLIADNEKLTVENTELNSKLGVAQEEVERTKQSCVADAEELKLLKSRYQQLDKRYNDLQSTHQGMISGSDAETKKLMQNLDATQQDLYRREDQLNQVSNKLDIERARLSQLQKELDSRNARLIELEKILSERDAAVDELKQKVSEALLGFEGEGLTVSKKNGKVYVSLDEKLLFKSGSTEVDAKGISALKKLARVLEQNTDINITIEGHTDDVPVVPGSQLKDNWDLSVRRATSIIRILLDGSTINPKRLTASGRGEFLPVDPAKTKEARQKNRRTEIILTPDLDQLFNILEN